MTESAAAVDKLFQAKRAVVVVIDNPHLAIASRIGQLTKRVLDNVGSNEIVITGNYPVNIEGINSSARMIPILPHRHIEDEQAFIDSFVDFSQLDLLNNIMMPVSRLNLFEVAGYDSLVFAYRASYEIDSSLPKDIAGYYDVVLIIGSSHFNYPFPERIIADFKRKKLIDDNTRMIGIPIGPMSGPLSPHWTDACDQVILAKQQSLDVLKRINPELSGVVLPELFAGIPKLPSQHAPDGEGRIRVFIDWTFIHNWQLKAVLSELSSRSLKEKIQLYMTAVSDETPKMLWAKWGHLLEELNPKWITIGTDEYYSSIAQMEIVIGFVFGRDIWVWRNNIDGIFICDFAGWWRAFGFEGPTPIASPQKLIDNIEEKLRS